MNACGSESALISGWAGANPTIRKRIISWINNANTNSKRVKGMLARQQEKHSTNDGSKGPPPQSTQFLNFLCSARQNFPKEEIQPISAKQQF